MVIIEGTGEVSMKRKYIAVLATLCATIAAGVGLTTNISGLFFTPMAESLGVGRGSISLTMTICNMAFAAGGIVFPKVMKRIQFKQLLIFGVVITVTATFLLSISHHIWLLYILNAVRGFSTGLLGTVMATIIVNQWFLSQNGLFTSIVMGCSGLGSAVFSPVFSRTINAFGWRVGYIISAALMMVLYLPLILIRISVDPEDVGEKPYGENDKKREDDKPSSGETSVSWRLLLLCCMYATLGGCLTAIVQHFPGIAESFALSSSVGAAMLSASMITNTSGKILLGFLIDRLGIVRSILIVAAAVALGVLMMIFVHQEATSIAGAALIGLGYSLATVGVSVMTRETFGLVNYGSTYSKTALCVTIAYALAAAGIGYLYDFLHSYGLIFLGMLATIAAMVFIMFVVYGTRKVKTDG